MKINEFFTTTLTLLNVPVLAEIDFSGQGGGTEEWDTGMDDAGLFADLENDDGALEVEEADESLIEYDLSWGR